MKHHCLLGRRGIWEGHVLTSCQVQHACLPQAMLGTDVLCQVRSHSTVPCGTEAVCHIYVASPSWDGWDGQTVVSGGEIRHGQDGGLCAGLPAEFRDLQKRRMPSHQTVFFGGWLVKIQDLVGGMIGVGGV